jgi:SAM-dependent methyltransferase
MLTAQLRKYWYKLGPGGRFIIRRLVYLPIDILDTIKGNTTTYVPPRGLMYTGRPCSPQQFLQEGKEQVDILIKEIELQPADKVLDIGAGIGRTAIALINYLSAGGSYHGFDVVAKGVNWCNKKIATRHPNFHFAYVPLHNDLYNESKASAEQFVFPYASNSFTKIFSFSVFTHMQVTEITHYLKEIYRVLQPGGLCLCTFFLYDDDTEHVLSRNAHFCFPYKKEGYSLMDEKTKSGNIAIDVAFLKRMAASSGLQIVKVVDGFWKDFAIKQYNKEYQDVVIFKKI